MAGVPSDLIGKSWRPSNSPVGTIKTRTYVYSDQVLAPFQLPSWYNRRDGERGRMGVLAPFQLPSWYNQVEVRQPGHGVLAPFQLPSWYNRRAGGRVCRLSLGALPTPQLVQSKNTFTHVVYESWRPSNSPVGTITYRDNVKSIQSWRPSNSPVGTIPGSCHRRR